MNLALLGYPLGHSLSPAMQNAALAAAGLEGRYQALPVPPAELADAIQRVRAGEFDGANVTVPHKEVVLPLLDGLTPAAEAIGAANTLVKQEGRLLGHNTDAAGFLTDLHAVGARAADEAVLVLGAGGSARAVVAALAGVGAEVRVMARRRVQAESLASVAAVEIFDWTPLDILLACDDCAVIVNCTPLGMSPNVAGSPWIAGTPFPPDAFVYDLVYNPPETRFVQQARAAGLRAATGLGMLVEQGALAFELWTGVPAPRDVMRAAAEEKSRHS
jgi:shikimate dehydrogenase